MNKKKTKSFELMTVDELWLLYGGAQSGSVSSTYVGKTRAGKAPRAASARKQGCAPPKPWVITPTKGDRRYPRVLPKYRNPDEPLEIWSGRGKTPRWLIGSIENRPHHG